MPYYDVPVTKEVTSRGSFYRPVIAASEVAAHTTPNGAIVKVRVPDPRYAPLSDPKGLRDAGVKYNISVAQVRSWLFGATV